MKLGGMDGERRDGRGKEGWTGKRGMDAERRDGRRNEGWTGKGGMGGGDGLRRREPKQVRGEKLLVLRKMGVRRT